MSFDLAERYFCCDLEACKGQCCLDGDAGAPLDKGEADEIRRILPEIWDDLLPAAKREIEENGVSYIDIEGDEVTALVEGGPVRFCHCSTRRVMALRHRKRIPPGAHRLHETRIVPSLSCKAKEVRWVYGSQSAPLAYMQSCRSPRQGKRNQGLSVSRRAAPPPVWRRMVRRIETDMRRIQQGIPRRHAPVSYSAA